MSVKLPLDLFEAESMAFYAIDSALNSQFSKRLSVNLKFEGLRIMPVAIRFAERLIKRYPTLKIVWPDAGATALAKRDSPALADRIFSFREYCSLKEDDTNSSLVLAVSPNAFDFDSFEELCNLNNDVTILMLNGKLEDKAVGIGSVARDRRKRFLSIWNDIFCLEPLTTGAIMMSYPLKWMLFRLDSDGYRFIQDFEARPNQEELIDYI